MLSRFKLSSPLPAILWAVLVAVVLLVPGGLADSHLDWAAWLAWHGGDKLVHLALFFGQTFWLSGVLGKEHRGATWRAAALAALYGLGLESAQLAVPGRGFEVADVAANTLGAFLWPVFDRLLRRG